MEKTTSLPERIDSAISDHIKEAGGGIPLGYVICLSRIDELGRQVFSVIEMENQNPVTSLGLTAYLQKTFEMDLESDLLSAGHICDECDDEDDE